MPYKEGCHPIFPYTEEDKQGVRKELGLKESTIQDDIDAMIDWFEKQPHLIAAGLPERDFLERMLINAKGARETAKRRMDNFYKHRGLAPELIQNRESLLDPKRDIWSIYMQGAMPKLFEYKRVSVLKFTDPDPNKYAVEIIMRNALMLGDLRLKYDYMLSDIWILDLKNTGIGHLLRTNPVIFSKATNIFLDGFGIRLHSVHIIGAPGYAHQLIQFLSKFAKPKIMERVKFHDSVEELYEHIPKQYLPKDYGGDQPSLEYYKEQYLATLRSEETKQFLIDCSKQVSHEILRPGYICEDYLDGTFKKLDLD